MTSTGSKAFPTTPDALSAPSRLWHPDLAALPKDNSLPWIWRKLGYCRPIRWAYFHLWALLFGLKMRGLENIPPDKPLIFLGNHGSHYDVFLMMAVLMKVTPRTAVPVVWYRMLDYPVAGAWLRSFRSVPVDNEAPRVQQRTKALRSMIRHLQEGRHLLIFPEAVRYDALGYFHPGSALAALKTGAPLVPFTLRGLQPLFKDLDRMPRLHGKVEIIFHPPVEPREAGERKGEEAAQWLMAQARSALAGSLDYPDAMTKAV